jgi:hypothetical protein
MHAVLPPKTSLAYKPRGGRKQGNPLLNYANNFKIFLRFEVIATVIIKVTLV